MPAMCAGAAFPVATPHKYPYTTEHGENKMLAYTVEENDWLSKKEEKNMEKNLETAMNTAKNYFEGLFDLAVKATQDVVKFNQDLAQEFVNFNQGQAKAFAKVFKYPEAK